MSIPTRPRPLMTAGGVVTGLLLFALGAIPLADVDSAFGGVGAALFVVLGAVVLLSAVAGALPPLTGGESARRVTLDGEEAQFYRRSSRRSTAGVVVLTLLGLWAVALGVVGGTQESWLWAVLAVPLAVYLLGAPVLTLAGRLGSGGVWVTPTRIVNLEQGVRSEIAYGDLDGVLASPDHVRIYPAVASQLTTTPLTPRIWRGAVPQASLVVVTAGTALDSDELAADLQRRADAVHNPGEGRAWGRRR